MGTLFVTGTGTEVGKTLVTCALAHQLRQTGVAVRAIKPVVSGFDPGADEADDCAQLLAAQGQPADTPLDQISPWRFKAALSPDMAAAAEGRELPFSEVVGFSRQAAQGQTWLLIEGIGGVMVPLDDSHTVLDWIQALHVPALVVGGSYLGTLSHTLSTCAVLQQRKIHIQAVLVSESSDSPVELEATCSTLRRFLPGIAVRPIARLAGPDPWRHAPDLTSVAGCRDAPERQVRT